MGKRGKSQPGLFVPHTRMPRSTGHAFYEAVERVLREKKFDQFVERRCRRYYHAKLGRPGVPPGVYFRCLLVGYFEGIDSERGIAWRVADSLSLREFLGLSLDKNPPDHSTLSRTRRLIDLETHREVFGWMLAVLGEHDLVVGSALGVDATSLEANAALRSIVRRDNGQPYEEFLAELAKASGIKTPTRQDLARLDRKRRKKGSNDDWKHPHDPDAQITKMKDGRTHLAHKQEHAVDLDTGAIVGVTIHGGAEGDTKTIEQTLDDAERHLAKARKAGDEVAESVDEVVADKGYHSNAVLVALEQRQVRSYISEPDRGRRKWKGKDAERDAVYNNRRRKNAPIGCELLRRRGELVERSFAHTLETGGMRRVHLRGHNNILKRMLIHIAGFNLGLLMRKTIGVGTPRSLQDRQAPLVVAFFALIASVVGVGRLVTRFVGLGRSNHRASHDLRLNVAGTRQPLFTTGC